MISGLVVDYRDVGVNMEEMKLQLVLHCAPPQNPTIMDEDSLSKFPSK